MKLSRAQVYNIIDRVTSSLPGWMAKLMNRAGRAVYAQFIMSAKVIYTAITVDLPLWAVKAIEKILRGFVWKGRKEAKLRGGALSYGMCQSYSAEGTRRAQSL
jgi:hypothetical protein